MVSRNNTIEIVLAVEGARGPPDIKKDDPFFLIPAAPNSTSKYSSADFRTAPEPCRF